jgi:nitrogen regulatory protein P-II 1
MKKIEALISPESIARVQELMEERHISNFMFSNVIAKPTHCARQQLYRGHAYAVEFDAEVKLEAVVQDDQATDTARAILKAAAGPQPSCKPRVLLTPVSQVMFPLDEISPDHEPPTRGARQPVHSPVRAGARTASAVERPHALAPRVQCAGQDGPLPDGMARGESRQ